MTDARQKIPIAPKVKVLHHIRYIHKVLRNPVHHLLALYFLCFHHSICSLRSESTATASHLELCNLSLLISYWVRNDVLNMLKSPLFWVYHMYHVPLNQQVLFSHWLHYLQQQPLSSAFLFVMGLTVTLRCTFSTRIDSRTYIFTPLVLWTQAASVICKCNYPHPRIMCLPTAVLNMLLLYLPAE